jgi:hypothetical protein
MLILLALVSVLAVVTQAQSDYVLLAEDFEDLPLGPNVEEGASGDAVWTDTPPAGWIIDDSGVPGAGTASDGVTEWAGWSFADKDWWILAAGDQDRSLWTQGSGTVMIADPDEWDDASHGAGEYDAFVSTRAIDISAVEAGSIQLTFDSSFRDYAQMTGSVAVSYDGGAPIDVLLLESNGVTAYVPPQNETLTIDLNNPAGAQSAVITFGLTHAGNDWWWAVDNIVVTGERAAERAVKPNPRNGAEEVPVKTVLSWTPGDYVGGLSPKHRVILSDSFSAVENGTAVVSTQDPNNYDATGYLDFGTTYYWRIDEANSVSGWDEGVVWSFTVESLAYPIANVTASSTIEAQPGSGPENTVNGSGLNENDEHSTESTDMWQVSPVGGEPFYIEYEFDRVYKLHELLVWNYNVQFELLLGFGVKDATIEYSEDGVDWTALGDVAFNQATATSTYRANTTVAFNGVAAQYVRLTVNSGYGMTGQFGLSEVRFMFIPAHAREPQPADGASEVSPSTVLAWRTGRDATSHEIYLSSDEAAVADGTALVDTVTESSYPISSLDFGNNYFWRIDEIQETEAWAGDIWSFATQAFAVIDDMESYDDDENRIFDTWLDSFVNDTGSTVGYFEAPFAEQTIVNSGSQSMPLEYDNSAAPFYSEAELDLGSLNLDTNAADSLRLFVSGQAPAFFETADGTILMNGIGNDIWGSTDEFRYTYKLLTGDGSITARVDALDGTPNSWAKGGVMIRQSAEGGAVNTFMAMTGGDGGGATYQQRMDADSASVSQHTYADGPLAPPYWVRVTREGNTLLGFTSPDGEIWTQRGDTVTLAMTDPVLIGLALTSHNAGQATSAAFSNVSTTGNVTGNWQIAEVGVAQPEGNIPETLYVALEDTSGNVAVVTHPDASITAKSGWPEWLIPYSDLAGVNLNRVAIVYIGVGNRDNPTAGGTGRIFIDDVGYGRPTTVE